MSGAMNQDDFQERHDFKRSKFQVDGVVLHFLDCLQGEWPVVSSCLVFICLFMYLFIFYLFIYLFKLIYLFIIPGSCPNSRHTTKSLAIPARPQGFLVMFILFDTCECEMLYLKSACPRCFRSLSLLSEK